MMSFQVIPRTSEVPRRADPSFTMSIQAAVTARQETCAFHIEMACVRPRPATGRPGGARRDRTDDLMLAKHALSQLSYGPVTRRRMPRSMKVVGLGRLELPTSRLSSARSNQLSYKPEAPPQTPGRGDCAAARPGARPGRTRVRPGRKRNEGGDVPQIGPLNGPLFQAIR